MNIKNRFNDVCEFIGASWETQFVKQKCWKIIKMLISGYLKKKKFCQTCGMNSKICDYVNMVGELLKHDIRRWSY